jgi:hypothetical protein
MLKLSPAVVLPFANRRWNIWQCDFRATHPGGRYGCWFAHSTTSHWAADISNYGLPTLMHMHMLDPNEL